MVPGTGKAVMVPDTGKAVTAPDMRAHVGRAILRNPVMTASGTAGYSDELSAYMDLSALGAVVVKSLSAYAWNGNPAPRLAPTDAGMLNSVGLQNPGVSVWRYTHLPKLARTGASVVASIWGQTVSDYRKAAAELAASGLTDAGLVAVEVNISCPNLESSNEIFAHSPDATAAVVAAVVDGLTSVSEVSPTMSSATPGPRPAGVAGAGVAGDGANGAGVAGDGANGAGVAGDGANRSSARAASVVPVWAKLSPNTSDIVAISASALEAGAEALTLTNTLSAMVIDPERGRPVLGSGTGGGLSGPALRPVALRAVYEVRAALGPVPIVGVGGIGTTAHALEFLAAGASAVQIGTATFADPRSPQRIAEGLSRYCSQRNIASVGQLVGIAHES